MITIVEDKPKKIPGSTSLFVGFEFNVDIIETIKKRPVFYYDKKTQLWEVPATDLAYLLDNLTYIDDIEVTFYEEKDIPRSEMVPVTNYKTKPLEHQMKAIRYGIRNPKWLLLDEPGLGKTLSVIYIAQELKQQKGLEHCLVICAVNTLKTNWANEIKKHSDLSCRVLGQKINRKGNIYYASVADRCKELEEPIKEFFIITNIESIRDEKFVKAFLNSKNKIDMVVVDECHKSANKNSQQGKNLLKIKSDYQIGLTGTPLTNTPLSLYLPLMWIGKNNSTLTAFKNYYCDWGGPFNNILIKYKNLDVLKYQLAQCSLRRTQDILHLPPKTIIDEIVDMSDTQRVFYDNIKEGVKEEADKIDLKSGNLLSLVTRLRQATACPQLLTSKNIESSKVERAVDLTEQIVANGNKVVIFSTFKEPVNRLAQLLSDYKPLIVTGDVDDKTVNDSIKTFQTDNEHKVLIATISKLGVGVTLNRANYAIFIDTAWTQADQKQSEDRIYRIGSDRPVFIYRLICKDSIDERVSGILAFKKALAQFLVDGHLDEEGMNILSRYVPDIRFYMGTKDDLQNYMKDNPANFDTDAMLLDYLKH